MQRKVIPSISTMQTKFIPSKSVPSPNASNVNASKVIPLNGKQVADTGKKIIDKSPPGQRKLLTRIILLLQEKTASYERSLSTQKLWFANLANFTFIVIAHFSLLSLAVKDEIVAIWFQLLFLQ